MFWKSLTHRMGPPAGRLYNAALWLLYPPRCCACDTLLTEVEERAFCEECVLSLELIPVGCTSCGTPLPGNDSRTPTCLRCLQRRPLFTSARAPFQFGGALAEAIRRLKWAQLPELARPLGHLLGPLCQKSGADVIVPVPLHSRRLRSREFNQAALLALAARPNGGSLRLDLAALVRVRDTVPQTSLSPVERWKNVHSAFVARPRRVLGKKVLLIDDVYTTGATVSACSQALLQAGAKEVKVLTLAHAVP